MLPRFAATLHVGLRAGAMVLALATVSAVAACHRASNSDANSSTIFSRQSPAPAPVTAALSDARLVLPAVRGNPAAAYFTLANTTSAPITVTGLDVTGSDRVEMHETVGGAMRDLARFTVAPGEMVRFAPGGRHGMVFGLDTSLNADGSTELAVHLADGKTLTAPMRIERPGGDVMAGMKMNGKADGAMASMPGMKMAHTSH